MKKLEATGHYLNFLLGLPFLLHDILHGEDLDIHQDDRHREGFVVPLVIKRQSSDAVSDIGEPNSALANMGLVINAIILEWNTARFYACEVYILNTSKRENLRKARSLLSTTWSALFGKSQSQIV